LNPSVSTEKLINGHFQRIRLNIYPISQIRLEQNRIMVLVGKQYRGFAFLRIFLTHPRVCNRISLDKLLKMWKITITFLE